MAKKKFGKIDWFEPGSFFHGEHQPRYPIFIPSKGRYDYQFTVRVLQRDGVENYRVVIEPHEYEQYVKLVPADKLVVLPWSTGDIEHGSLKPREEYCEKMGIENGGLVAVRNWIRDLAESEGHARHWQLDDNLRYFKRWYKGQKLMVNGGLALRVCEDFTEQFENVGISGLNYTMFAVNDYLSPWFLNCRVYSCTLVNHASPSRWRLAYNDDTDLCLQTIADGWCTILLNTFLCEKLWTMLVPGGNTTDLYQGDGRAKMARSLERKWPGVVHTGRRFQRPQHIVHSSWRKFDTELIKAKKPVEIPDYNLRLVVEKENVRSKRLKRWLDEAPEYDPTGNTPEGQPPSKRGRTARE